MICKKLIPNDPYVKFIPNDPYVKYLYLMIPM